MSVKPNKTVSRGLLHEDQCPLCRLYRPQVSDPPSVYTQRDDAAALNSAGKNAFQTDFQ